MFIDPQNANEMIGDPCPGKGKKFPIVYRKVARIYEDGGYKGKPYYRAIIPAGVAGKEWRRRRSSVGELKTLIDAEYPAILAKAEPLSVSETFAYREATNLLPIDVTLMDAVKGYLKYYVKDSPTLKEAIDKYIDFVTLKGIRRPDLKRDNLKKFEPLYGMRLCDITSEDVWRCLEPHKDVPGTFRTYRNHLNTFFRWAIGQEIAQKNPVTKIVNPRNIDTLREFYPPERVLVALATAKKFYPESIPYYATCFFSGVRPQTVERLDWAMFDFNKRQIPIAANINKTHYPYIAFIPDNLIEWLKPYRKARGPLLPDSLKDFRNHAQRWVRERLPFPWIQDGARHTFVTYTYELEDVNITLARMGDKNPYTLFNHYKGHGNRADAERFFNLVPSDLDNVIIPEWKKPVRGRPKNSSRILPEKSEIDKYKGF